MKQFFRKFSVTLLLAFAMYGMAMAQLDISGTVKSTKGEPLIGVTVAVKNSNVGTVTDVDGKYSLHISGSNSIVVFSYVGYHSIEKGVSSSGTIDVTLEETSSTLEEVVVSGLATTVKRANAANAVSEINSKELTGITPPSTFDGALQGKFPGVQITNNSGAPGGGINVRMRGITSINSSTQPLYIIDGVYVDNSSIPAGLNAVSLAAANGNPRQFDQDNPSNRVADLDPGDFQSVEILKGPSAAAIYGARAAGGVVIINTKRGSYSPGAPQVNFSQSLGWQQILHPLGVRQWDDQKVADYFGAGSSEIQNFDSASNAGALHDYENELYGNHGVISDSRLSVSSGNEKTSFYASGFHHSEDGIVPNTGYTKTGLRLNIDHHISKMLDLSMTSNYIKSSADRGYFNNDNSGTTMSISLSSTPTWAQLEKLPDGSYPNNPYAPANFLQTAALITNNEAVDRFIVGGTATANIVNSEKNSLKLILQGGLDDYTMKTTAIFPRELQFEKDGNGTNGASIQGTTPSFNNNESLFLVHSYFTPSISFRTQFGLTRESFDRNTMIVTAEQLIGTQTNVNQAGSVSTFQFRSNQLDLGGFGEEEVNWQDKIIATLGVRADKSSNNADPNQLFWYPKASLAVNIAQFMQDRSQLSTLKLRAAYGQSSNFPPNGALFTNLKGVIIDGQAGSFVNSQRGNENIGPERQKEFETGIDAGILNDRITFEGTYYNKTSSDLIFLAQVPLSSGYTNQYVNGGTLVNHGFELTLNADVIKKGDFSWFSGISWWQNRSKVTELNVPEFAPTSAFGASLGQFYIQQGKSATQLVGIGPDSLKEVVGKTVTGEDSLAKYVVYGDYEPDFQMSFYEEFHWKGFSLTFLIHWKEGGDNVNLTTLLTDFGGTSHDYDDTNLDPSGQLTNGPYRISQFLGGVSAGPFVQKAGYVRVREIGLYYTFDVKKLESSTRNIVKGVQIGISAHNPLNWFKYNSYDPEVSNFVGDGLSSGVEVNPFPSSKSFLGSLSVNF